MGPSAPGSSCRYWIIFLKYNRPSNSSKDAQQDARRAPASAPAGPQANSVLAAAWRQQDGPRAGLGGTECCGALVRAP